MISTFLPFWKRRFPNAVNSNWENSASPFSPLFKPHLQGKNRTLLHAVRQSSLPHVWPFPLISSLGKSPSRSQSSFSDLHEKSLQNAFPKVKDWGQQKWENSIFCARGTFYDSLHILHWAFGKYHQRAALAVDYAKAVAQSKAMFLYNFLKSKLMCTPYAALQPRWWN